MHNVTFQVSPAPLSPVKAPWYPFFNQHFVASCSLTVLVVTHRGVWHIRIPDPHTPARAGCAQASLRRAGYRTAAFNHRAPPASIAAGSGFLPPVL